MTGLIQILPTRFARELPTATVIGAYVATVPLVVRIPELAAHPLVSFAPSADND